ncbi:MAG: hypothetical protein AAF243_15655 [Cyanobacteria bacterium P01_A01_bin.137]
MAVLSLKTELDVAELLLTEGWLPKEINGILVFPLPGAVFCQLKPVNCQEIDGDVIEAATATPTTIYRARQLLESAGWQEQELDSLLKPYLYGGDAWANLTINLPNGSRNDQGVTPPLLGPSLLSGPSRLSFLPSLGHYRRTMALRRILSLVFVIALVSVTVILLG